MRSTWFVAFTSALTLTATACAAGTTSPPDQTDPAAYRLLREGYAARDASQVSSAYAPNGVVRFETSTPVEQATGKAEIAALYQRLLDDLPSDAALDLNFRIDSRREKDSRIIETGAYRLKAGQSGAGFGRFAVDRDPATGLFLLDRSLAGDRDDFERMAGPLLFAADTEDLDPEFYGRLTGRYALKDGCQLVVTHSVVRVLVRNTCDGSWRGLERVSGTEYTMGDTLAPSASLAQVSFELPESGDARALTITAGQKRQTASRADIYSRERVTFAAGDGTQLGGTLWTPKGQPSAATVLVHGSGPQDRNGYASIIAVMADSLAAEGHIVLTYDKRGSGESGGDGGRAGFGQLGADAEAARAFVKTQTGAKDIPSGFAGSSQAGWVVADAIRQGAAPDHVILVGAAGAALTVEEQNLYNTGVQMRCGGFNAGQIDMALRQQRAFFDFLKDGAKAKTLDAITQEAARDAALQDWLFPASGAVDRSSPDWYNVLDLSGDPRAVWRTYQGNLFLILGRHDDSTPTQEVVRRWDELNRGRATPARLFVLPDAQHIGLKVSGECQTDFRQISGFDPDFFDALRAAAAVEQ